MAMMIKSSAMLGCAVALSATLTLAGTTTPAWADKTHPVIGFAVYGTPTFIITGKQGAQTIADANGATLLWVSAKMDVQTQISQVQQFIDQKVDAIVICPVDPLTLGPSVLAAKAAGIPVIVGNQTLSDDAMANVVSYVGPDDVKAGEAEASSVMDAIGHKGGVVVLQGPLGISAEVGRTQGIKNILAKNPDVKLLAIQTAGWLRTEAYQMTLDLLSKYGDQMNGIIAENDDMANGAIQALKDKSLSGKIPVSGIDGTKEGLRNVQAGTQIETNLQNSLIELGLAVQIAVDQVQGRPIPSHAIIIMPPVTKDNVKHYYDDMYVNAEKFNDNLAVLVKKNLASGAYADQ